MPARPTPNSIYPVSSTFPNPLKQFTAPPLHALAPKLSAFHRSLSRARILVHLTSAQMAPWHLPPTQATLVWPTPHAPTTSSRLALPSAPATGEPLLPSSFAARRLLTAHRCAFHALRRQRGYGSNRSQRPMLCRSPSALHRSHGAFVSCRHLQARLARRHACSDRQPRHLALRRHRNQPNTPTLQHAPAA
jgi:hypothetical protein